MLVLRYAERLLLVRDLGPERDPNFIELCAAHADGMTPPVGWTRRDERLPKSVAVLDAGRPERTSPARRPQGIPLGGAEEALAAPAAATGSA